MRKTPQTLAIQLAGDPELLRTLPQVELEAAAVALASGIGQLSSVPELRRAADHVLTLAATAIDLELKRRLTA